MNRSQEELFDSVYKAYAKLLLRTIRLYVKDPYECEDILQEVFVKRLLHKKKFVSQEHEKYWLMRVAINKAKDYQRALHRGKLEPLNLEMLEEVKTCDLNLRDLVNGLKLEQKEVVILHYYYGYTMKEIAEILRVKESTVKMRLHRARKTMRLEMEEGIYEL